MQDDKATVERPEWRYTYQNPFKREEYREAARTLRNFDRVLAVVQALRALDIPLPTDDTKAAQAMLWLLYEVAPNV